MLLLGRGCYTQNNSIFSKKKNLTPKLKEMTNYVLSTNDRVGKIRLPFISSSPLRALISGGFTFRSKVSSLTLGKENSKLSVCQNAISNGSAARSGYLRSQQPQSAVDFKEGMGLPWAGLPSVHVPGGKTSAAPEASIPWCQALLRSQCEGFRERLQLARF